MEEETPTTRLSESSLWDLSAQYYQVSGLDAWESGTVPYYITSNSFIAHRYAEMICELVDDWHAQGDIDLDQPVYVYVFFCVYLFHLYGFFQTMFSLFLLQD